MRDDQEVERHLCTTGALLCFYVPFVTCGTHARLIAGVVVFLQPLWCQCKSDSVDFRSILCDKRLRRDNEAVQNPNSHATQKHAKRTRLHSSVQEICPGDVAALRTSSY